MIINSINGNANFKAKLKRNWDGVAQETKAEVLATYDNAINEIKIKRVQAAELDAFMHSDEVKPLLEQLPKKDMVNILNHNVDALSSDAQYFDGPPKLEYFAFYLIPVGILGLIFL